MAFKWKQLTHATRPVNELGPNGECYYCDKKHYTWGAAIYCYEFEDAYRGFDKDWNCRWEGRWDAVEGFKKYNPDQESETCKSFLMLGYLGDKLVKYIEFHRTNDAHQAFGNYDSDGPDEFLDNVRVITSKAFQKAKDSLGAHPGLPDDIKDKVTNLENTSEEYDLTVITEISVFENHSDEDVKILRSTHKSLAEIYDCVGSLGHFTYCHDHGRATKRCWEDDCDDVMRLEMKMCEFELPEFWK